MYSLNKIGIFYCAYIYIFSFGWLSCAQVPSAEEVRWANRVTRDIHFKEVNSDVLQAIVNTKVVTIAKDGCVKWFCKNCNNVLEHTSSYSSRRSHLFGCDKRLRKKFPGPYVCLVKGCGHQLYHQGSIYAHVQMKHVPQAYFRYCCSVCKKMYSHKGVAWQHIRKCHDGEGDVVDRCYPIDLASKKRKFTTDHTSGSKPVSKARKGGADEGVNCRKKLIRRALPLMQNAETTNAASTSSPDGIQERPIYYRSTSSLGHSNMLEFRERASLFSMALDVPGIASEHMRCLHPNYTYTCLGAGVDAHASIDSSDPLEAMSRGISSLPAPLDHQESGDGDVGHSVPVSSDPFGGLTLEAFLDQKTIEGARRRCELFSPRSMSDLLSNSPMPFLSERINKNVELEIFK